MKHPTFKKRKQADETTETKNDSIHGFTRQHQQAALRLGRP